MNNEDIEKMFHSATGLKCRANTNGSDAWLITGFEVNYRDLVKLNETAQVKGYVIDGISPIEKYEIAITFKKMVVNNGIHKSTILIPGGVTQVS